MGGEIESVLLERGIGGVPSVAEAEGGSWEAGGEERVFKLRACRRVDILKSSICLHASPGYVLKYLSGHPNWPASILGGCRVSTRSAT